MLLVSSMTDAEGASDSPQWQIGGVFLCGRGGLMLITEAWLNASTLGLTVELRQRKAKGRSEACWVQVNQLSGALWPLQIWHPQKLHQKIGSLSDLPATESLQPLTLTVQPGTLTSKQQTLISLLRQSLLVWSQQQRARKNQEQTEREREGWSLRTVFSWWQSDHSADLSSHRRG